MASQILANAGESACAAAARHGVLVHHGLDAVDAAPCGSASITRRLRGRSRGSRFGGPGRLATATSLAAFSMAGAVPPARSASKASARQGKRREVGRSNASAADRRQVELAPRRTRCAPDRRAHGRSACACRGCPVGPAPSRRRRTPSNGSRFADGSPPRSARQAAPNSQCASITSRPLFIMVAESTEILRPIDPVRMRAGLVRRDVRRSVSTARFRNGPPDAVSRILATPCAAGVARIMLRQALEDRVVLAVDRQQRRAVLATASMNSWPDITSASLFASRTFLPARAAASVGRQAGGADDGGHHGVGVRAATAIVAQRRFAVLRPRSAAFRRSSSRQSRGRLGAMPTHGARGRNARHCAASSSTRACADSA